MLKRDLHFRDNFKRALEGNPTPAPQFLWPMLGEMTIPTLVIRGTESDMFAAGNHGQGARTNPRIKTVEIAGSHNLSGDNPQGLRRRGQRRSSPAPGSSAPAPSFPALGTNGREPASFIP